MISKYQQKSYIKKLIYFLSSFGLLSTFGYYLINVEQEALGKSQITPPSMQERSVMEAKEGIVISVVDGDTIKVRTEKGQSITVRMLGIDTPETSHSPRAEVRGVADCFADEATEALKGMVLNKQVQLKADKNKDKYDKYGRLLAYVFLVDEYYNVNHKMILDGFAYEYTYHGQKYQYQKSFKMAQKEAERSEAGLWAPDVCELAG